SSKWSSGEAGAAPRARGAVRTFPRGTANRGPAALGPSRSHAAPVIAAVQPSGSPPCGAQRCKAGCNPLSGGYLHVSGSYRRPGEDVRPSTLMLNLEVRLSLDNLLHLEACRLQVACHLIRSEEGEVNAHLVAPPFI